MHYYPEDQSKENLAKIRWNNVCSECGRQLSIYLGAEKKIYIACSGQVHEGIVREYKPQAIDYESNIRRELELEQKVGTKGTQALAIPKHGHLTQPQAMHILKLVYPKAPDDEIIRCAILCRDFGLHPLMKEVYLIPFKEKSGKDNYTTVLGINATRKLMALRGTYSYFDDTPRLMTEEEQKRIFGEVDKVNIVAITKLRTKDGLEAPGYGRWPKSKDPYGIDKGNTKANMAFIRSERNAFGRLSPDALPPNVEVIDDAYIKVPDIGKVDTFTGEITESTTSLTEETQLEPANDNPYSQLLDSCPEHGDPWFKDKFGSRSHKMPEGWCKFRKQIDPIAAQLAKPLFTEEAELKQWMADNYSGKTWAKLTEEEQVDALGGLHALAHPSTEAQGELQPEDIPF